MKMLSTLVLSLFLTTSGYSATLEVPGDYNTIQEALDAALSGDTILVHPGTYFENLSVADKELFLNSSGGPYQTLIDGSQTGRVIEIGGGPHGNHFSLTGFTITNGLSGLGGGIYSDADWSLTLDNNHIRNNTAGGWGGGIYKINGSLTLTHCLLVENSAEDRSGGAVYLDSCNAVIKHNTFRKNSADKTNYYNSFGGAIHNDGTSNSEITDNQFTDNSAWAGGSIDNSAFMTLDGNRFTRNDAVLGGAVYTHGLMTMTNCLLVKNSALGGGAVFCQGIDNILAWNTICDNTARFEGGGLATWGEVYITHTIFWNNRSVKGKELSIDWFDPHEPTLSINHSIVEGSLDSVCCEGSLDWGPSMGDVDPLFADQRYGDYHLTSLSPLVNAGDNTVSEFPEFDMEGDPRNHLDAVDIGADEYHIHLYIQGIPEPDQPITVKALGKPYRQVALFRSQGIQDPPTTTPWGDFYLQLPVSLIGFGQSNEEGVLSWDFTIPSAFPVPHSIPLQGLYGEELTNLEVLNIQ